MHLLEGLKSKALTVSNTSQDRERQGFSFPAGVSVKQYHHSGKNLFQ